jgi:hypothetical protein
MFADLKRFSSNSGVPTFNGDAIGGGGSAGVIVAERWSIALTLDQGTTTSKTTPIPIGVLAVRIDVPLSRFQSQTTNRVFAASVLLGYHAESGHRIRPGVVGGLTFVHVRRRYNTIGPVPLVSGAAAPSSFAYFTPGGTLAPGSVSLPVASSLVVRPIEVIDNVPAATVGAEAAIELTSHLAAVPEVRAHAFSLSNGPSGFAIRPGIALRWTF